MRFKLELLAHSSSSAFPCLICRRRFRRSLELLRGSSELELELELGLSTSCRSLIFCFLRRSFLLPHLPFFFSFGIAKCSLAYFGLSHQGMHLLLR